MYLYLFLTLLSCACGDSQWYVGSGLTTGEMELLLQTGCFHGSYGGGSLNSMLVLSRCPHSQLEPIDNFSTIVPLCVLEFDHNLDNKLLQTAEAMIDNHNNNILLYKKDQNFIISYTEDSVELCDPTAFSKGWVANAITVPLSPYNQPRGKPVSFNLTDPDPAIAAAISKASADSQKAFLTKLTSFYTRNSLSQEAIDASEYLEEMYLQYGFEVSKFDFSDGYSPVVIAELNGKTHPEEIVVVGAHYDSRSTNSYDTTQRAPGADDNGSGTVNLLELARIISESRLTFDYTIRICSFSGEEQGLLGSRALAKKWAEEDVKIIAMFNGDMLGWKLPELPITLGMKDRYISEWLLDAANAVSSLYVPELPIGSSSSCCSDHQGFTEAGYPAIGFFENIKSASNYPDYHKSTDVLANVNFAQVLLISRAMMANVMTFASLISNKS